MCFHSSFHLVTLSCICLLCLSLLVFELAYIYSISPTVTYICSYLPTCGCVCLNLIAFACIRLWGFFLVPHCMSIGIPWGVPPTLLFGLRTYAALLSRKSKFRVRLDWLWVCFVESSLLFWRCGWFHVFTKYRNGAPFYLLWFRYHFFFPLVVLSCNLPPTPLVRACTRQATVSAWLPAVRSLSVTRPSFFLVLSSSAFESVTSMGRFTSPFYPPPGTWLGKVNSRRMPGPLGVTRALFFILIYLPFSNIPKFMFFFGTGGQNQSQTPTQSSIPRP